jgi:chromosome segregation ATPase
MAKTVKDPALEIARIKVQIQKALARLAVKETALAAENNPEVRKLNERLKALRKRRGAAARMRALFSKKLNTLRRQVSEKSEAIASENRVHESTDKEIRRIEDRLQKMSLEGFNKAEKVKA